jgi:hemerythrin-like domain-containing protein
MDELLREHELIEQVAGSLLTYADRFRDERAACEDGAALLHFFRTYAGRLHHGREEDVLFPALVSEAALPETGPIAALLADHHDMAALLTGMEQILERDLDDDARGRFRDLAYAYSGQLLHHIDAENSVLIPESEARLMRAGVRELDVREATAEEQAAEHTGRELVERYPPSEDPDIVRGDGCIMCTSYGDRCEGLEREWWNEYEWAESDSHTEAG